MAWLLVPNKLPLKLPVKLPVKLEPVTPPNKLTLAVVWLPIVVTLCKFWVPTNPTILVAQLAVPTNPIPGKFEITWPENIAVLPDKLPEIPTLLRNVLGWVKVLLEPVYAAPLIVSIIVYFGYLSFDL